MNLIPLAALLLSCLAVAISVCAAVAVIRIQNRTPRRQYQSGGSGSIQVQSGGTIHLDEDQAIEASRRIAEQFRTGRHL